MASITARSQIQSLTGMQLISHVMYAFELVAPPSGHDWKGDYTYCPWKLYPLQYLIDPYFLTLPPSVPVRVICGEMLDTIGSDISVPRESEEDNTSYARRLLEWKWDSEVQ